jgi:hypothetical protein
LLLPQVTRTLRRPSAGALTRTDGNAQVASPRPRADGRMTRWHVDETSVPLVRAIAGLVSDRAARRAAWHRPRTELVPAFRTDGPGGLN